MNRLLASVRPWVVATRRNRLLAPLYRGAFALASDRILGALAAPPGTALFVRERGVPASFEAGISDLDLLVLLDDTLSPEARLAASAALLRQLARVQRGVPLVRDLHVLTEREFRAGVELGGSLATLLHAYARPLGSDALPSLDRAPTSTVAGQRLAQELFTFAVLRAARQYVETPGVLGRALAAHALAKAESIAPYARGSLATGPRGVVAAYGSVAAAAAADAGQVIESLRALDRLPWLEGPPLTPEPPLDHHGIRTRASAVRGWSEPLLRLEALRSVALLADSPAEDDVRLVVVLDPNHPRAARTLESLAGHVARAPAPPLVHGGATLRLHLKTPGALAHPGRHRTLSVEPLLRASALVLGEPLPPARITRAELARSLALGLGIASSAVRERADREPSQDERAKLSSWSVGGVPALRAFVRGESIAAAYDPGDARPRTRLEAARALDEATEALLPALMEIARPCLG